MRSCRFIGGLLAIVLMGSVLAGCRSNKPAENPAPATTGPVMTSPEVVAAIRAEFQKQNPNARVGQVYAVEPGTNLAAVGDVDLKDFHNGDPITFIDANQNVLTNGRVVGSQKFLHVQYDPPSAGQRAPQPGDLAVRAR